jgi:hypothetical protein
MKKIPRPYACDSTPSTFPHDSTLVPQKFHIQHSAPETLTDLFTNWKALRAKWTAPSKGQQRQHGGLNLDVRFWNGQRLLRSRHFRGNQEIVNPAVLPSNPQKLASLSDRQNCLLLLPRPGIPQRPGKPLERINAKFIQGF